MHQALLKRSYREGGTDKFPRTPEVSFQSIQEELKNNNNNLENVKYQFFFIFYNTYVNTINQELIYKDVKYLVYNHRKVIVKEVCFCSKESSHWHMLSSKEIKTRGCAGSFSLLLFYIFYRFKVSFLLSPTQVGARPGPPPSQVQSFKFSTILVILFSPLSSL